MASRACVGAALFVVSLNLHGCESCDTDAVTTCVTDETAKIATAATEAMTADATAPDYTALCAMYEGYFACYAGCCGEEGMTEATALLVTSANTAYACSGLTDPCA